MRTAKRCQERTKRTNNADVIASRTDDLIAVGALEFEELAAEAVSARTIRAKRFFDN